MLKQYDDRIAIFVKGTNVIYEWGCLFLQLIGKAEKRIGKRLKPTDVIKLYDKAVELNLMKPDCFVRNHWKIMNLTFQYLKSNLRCSYIAKIDLQGDDTWGDPNGFNEIIKESLTPNNNSHFYSLDYDSYFDLHFDFPEDLSIRFYKIA